MNDGLEIWASPTASKTIFDRAYAQNIILFDGKSLKVWAAPFEWALERKLRRIAFSDRVEKNVDMEDDGEKRRLDDARAPCLNGRR